MKHVMALIPLAALLLMAGASRGSPVSPVSPQTPDIAGLQSLSFIQEFKGGERACAIAIGKGKTNLGLYVYDSYGNCVAWDDVGRPASFDDMAVEWYPTQNGTYVIQVHNNGMRTNPCKIYMR